MVRATPALGARRNPKREPYDKVLIVCEGKKTERNYFQGLKNHLRLANANIVVLGEGATPAKVFSEADKRYKEEKYKSDPFDKVFCVFDKNTHNDYNDALQNIEPKRSFYAITSVPSFEYWLLLHFEYTTRPFTSVNILPRLREHFPGYDKSNQDIFSVLSGELGTAIGRAKKALREVQPRNSDNPSTKVHELVEYLQNIKR